MKIFFLDTSAFVKYYHEEVGSEEIKRIYSEEERVLVISDISITEFHSATARKVRRGEISKEAFEIVRKAFYKDLLNGLYDIEEFNERHKQRSIELIVSHSLYRNLFLSALYGFIVKGGSISRRFRAYFSRRLSVIKKASWKGTNHVCMAY